MKYNFDEQGVNFNYFLLSFLGLALIPATWSLVFSRSRSVVVAKTKKYFVPKTRNQRQSLFTKRFLFVVVGWVAVAYLVHTLRTTEVESTVAWDPYDILSLSSGSTPQEIKKQYRRLSLQWHPDKVAASEKEAAEEKYIEISKAYKVLTDDAARENYEKYGHPDGRQSFDMGIALPQWLVESHASPFVLGIYGLIFGLLMPLYVGRWWYRSMRYTKEGIYNKTMGHFFKELREGVNVLDMLELLTASTEFKQDPEYQLTDEAGAFDELANRVKDEVERISGEVFERSTKFPSDAAYRAKVLLYAHLYRIPLDNERLREVQAAMVMKSLHLLVGIQRIVETYSWLQPIFYTLELSQMLVQAIPRYGPSLLQLPHVDRNLAEEIMARKPTAAGIQKFKQLDAATRDRLLSSRPVEERKEMEEVLAGVPQLSVRNPTFKVLGDQIITPRAIMTFTATLTTKGDKAPITPVTPKQPKYEDLGEEEIVEDEDDGVNKLFTNDPDAASGNVPEVFAPYCAIPKHSFWWLILGDLSSGRFTVDPIRITDLSSSKSIKIQFQAPPKPGTYSLNLFIKSDSYMGCDVSEDLEFKVHQTSELPYESEPEDDISEPEADSLAGQMAQMRNQQGGGARPSGGDETSDDE
ncbi:secretory subunit [Dispira parvispora]|uniref:Secretory subunit n=1 Tax=Dispira parvispora TaxID=1520584 RepID=A0A9W8E8R3_9FUNG|nr:secretory subunit [Dispira parvispora]